MYDVKQVDPSEWSSPPWAAALVDKPGFGKVLMGRGAVNQKGPQAALLAALHAIRGGRTQAAGEPGAGRRGGGGDRLAAFRAGGAPAGGDGGARRSAAACSCPRPRRTPTAPSRSRWGPRGSSSWSWWPAARSGAAGPKKDVHSSNRARLDSPAFHLVQALATLVTAKGDPAIDGFAAAARPATAAQKAMLDAAAGATEGGHRQEAALGRSLGPRSGLAGLAGAVPVRAHGEHRGAGGGLHRAGRQDRVAPPGGGQAGPAAGAGHDLRQGGGQR